MIMILSMLLVMKSYPSSSWSLLLPSACPPPALLLLLHLLLFLAQIWNHPGYGSWNHLEEEEGDDWRKQIKDEIMISGWATTYQIMIGMWGRIPRNHWQFCHGYSWWNHHHERLKRLWLKKKDAQNKYHYLKDKFLSIWCNPGDWIDKIMIKMWRR